MEAPPDRHLKWLFGVNLPDTREQLLPRGPWKSGEMQAVWFKFLDFVKLVCTYDAPPWMRTPMPPWGCIMHVDNLTTST